MKLLIIDDSAFVRKMVINSIKTNLPETDIRVANDGREGLEIFRLDNPDAIITDLLMPEMTGQEVITEIRKEDNDVPIIVFSADIQQSVRAELFELGIVDFINKPFDNTKAMRITEILRGIDND